MRQLLKRLGAIAGLAMVGLLSGCMMTSVTMVEQHPQIMNVIPNQQYQVWWNQMQMCSGAKGELADIRIRVVEAAQDTALHGFTVDVVDGDILGMWDPALRTMYIGQRFLFDRPLVAHEMLHALGFKHDRTLFVDRCGVYY